VPSGAGGGANNIILFWGRGCDICHSRRPTVLSVANQKTLRICVLVACVAASAWPAWSQNLPSAAAGQTATVVERVGFEGNRRIRSETLQARIFTRAGDPYSEDGLRRDFQALWNTQYFEDIRLEVQDSTDRPNAKSSSFM